MVPPTSLVLHITLTELNPSLEHQGELNEGASDDKGWICPRVDRSLPPLLLSPPSSLPVDQNLFQVDGYLFIYHDSPPPCVCVVPSIYFIVFKTGSFADLWVTKPSCLVTEPQDCPVFTSAGFRDWTQIPYDFAWPSFLPRFSSVLVS